MNEKSIHPEIEEALKGYEAAMALGTEADINHALTRLRQIQRTMGSVAILDTSPNVAEGPPQEERSA